MKVINQVNYSNCGTLPDFGNFCMSEDWGSLKDNKCNNPYDPYLGVSEMLPRAFGLSAKSYEFDENGNETILDYYKLLSIVKCFSIKVIPKFKLKVELKISFV